MSTDVVQEWTHLWSWGKWPRGNLPIDQASSWDPKANPESRKGMECRVLAVGALNSALVEFEDGHTTVTNRQGLRRLSRPKSSTQVQLSFTF